MLRKCAGWLFAVAVAAWSAAAAWYLWPRWPAEPRVGDVIVFPDPEVRRHGIIALGALLVALLAFLLVTSLRHGPRRWDRLVTLVAGQIALALFPVPVLLLVLSILFAALAPPWYDLGRRRVDDTAYHLQMRETDGRLILTSELAPTRLFRRTRVIALSSGEHRTLALIRPVGRSEYDLVAPKSPPKNKCLR